MCASWIKLESYRCILHEAVHFAQAKKNGEATGDKVSSPNDSAEQEAERAVTALKSGEPVEVFEGAKGLMRKKYGSGLRENKKRDANRDGDKNDLGKDTVSDRAGVTIKSGGRDAFKITAQDAFGYYDDLSTRKVQLSTHHWCLVNPAAPKRLPEKRDSVGEKGDKFLLCQIVKSDATNQYKFKKIGRNGKPKWEANIEGSAWVNTKTMDRGDDLVKSVGTYRDKNRLSGDKNFNGKKKYFEFKGIDEKPESDQYVKPKQNGNANKLTDYGFRKDNGRAQATNPNSKKKDGWYNICINLSSHHGAGIANALGTPNETFVVYQEKNADQKVITHNIPTYSKNAKRSNKKAKFYYGHIEGDTSRYGWVWADSLKKKQQTPPAESQS